MNSAQRPRGGSGPILLFGTVVLASAGLLFAVEPLFAKMVLPLLGSTPSVWNTATVFYQAVLLAGYVYAHVVTRRVGRRTQVALHSCMAVLPFLLLPVAIRLGSPPRGDTNPIPWLLAVLALGVGAPFFVLSTTGPLLQRWFGGVGHARSGDPYFLYRASNIGSAIGLICYPLLAEPLLTLSQQALWWTAGYAIFVIALAGASSYVWWRGSAPPGVAEAAPASTPVPAPTWRRRTRWVVLAAVPSTWMLGLTLYLTTDLAPSPLLWVIPLGLYLITMNLAFGKRRILTRERCAYALPFLLIATVGTIELHASGPLWFLAPLHALTFFIGALVCHGELALDRPAVENLTIFYVWVALGGVIGGAVSGLLAPVVFPGFVEYPLALAIGAMLLPAHRLVKPARWWRDVTAAALVAFLVVAALVAGSLLNLSELAVHALAFGPAGFLCYTMVRRRLRFGLALGAVLLASVLPIAVSEQPLFAGRDFFGVSRVTANNDTGMHILYSGNIVHNEQRTTGPSRDEPLTYYTRQGPLGDVFRTASAHSQHWNVAVVGLGAGAMACYARPGQQWTFYEIDPLVARLAQDPTLFSYYHDCLNGNGSIVLGDGRLSLAAAPDHSYNLIVIDAFGSDVVPVHLLTVEAMDLYRTKLAAGGIIAFNVSNQYVDLRGVVGNVAAAEHMTCLARLDANTTAADNVNGYFASQWMVAAGPDADVASLARTPAWASVAGVAGVLPWTDDFSNLISVVHWQ